VRGHTSSRARWCARRRHWSPKGRIVTKAKGTGVGTPATPAAFPVTAQLVNRDSGTCWESSFTSFSRNEAGKVTAVIK
jgi:hypothetical protein